MEESSQAKFEIRDLRQKDQFITDDQFLNGYARFVGIYAVGVYISLCRHANKEQSSWPSIQKIREELDISKNGVIGSVKRLEFWNIIRKKRIGKTATNRYWLNHKKNWKPISEVHLKDFSEVCHVDFSSSLRKLHQFASRTSKKGDTSKEVKERRAFSLEDFLSLKEKGYKPMYWGQQMRFSKGRLWVLPQDGSGWLEFAGKEEDIEWK